MIQKIFFESRFSGTRLTGCKFNRTIR